MEPSQRNQRNPKRIVRACILGNAIIWAAVILAAAVVLQGTDCMAKMIPILGGGAGASVVVLGGGLSRWAR
jgi:hypothetical protein